MQGRNVMMGYLDQPDKTRQAITESGWLRSGDLGTMDDMGFFRITGKRNNSNNKNCPKKAALR